MTAERLLFHTSRATVPEARITAQVLLQLLLCASLWCLTLIHSTPATAAIFKCVDVSGNTTYTSTPCARDESTSLISKSAATIPGLDCRIAQKLAIDTTRRMKLGESSQALFDSYGGAISVSPFVVSLVSYVYSFDGNASASASRIATLTTERCQVGSFGPNTRKCDVYPYEFIQRLGGCEAAQSNDDPTLASGEVDAGARHASTADQSAAQRSVPSAATPVGNHSATSGTDPMTNYALPKLGEANPDEPASYALPTKPAGPGSRPGTAERMRATDVTTASAGGSQACRERLNESLDESLLQMRNAQDAATLDQLRNRQRQLKLQLSRC